MKVCVFNRSYWPDDGATGQLLAQLCEDLVARHGMEVTVVCGERPGDGGRGFGLVRRETRNGVENPARPRHHLRQVALRGSRRQLPQLLLLGLGGRAPRRASRRGGGPHRSSDHRLAALYAARRAGARFVYVCQDLFPEVTRLMENFRSRLMDAALERVGRALVARADRIVAVGETMRDRLVEARAPIPPA